MPRALITGITGQDGGYLAAFLHRQGYEVHGMLRPGGRALSPGILPANARISLHRAELSDAASLVRVLADAQPDELYHLAGQTHVGASFQDAVGACDATGLGTLRLLEAARQVAPRVRFFHASSSQVFGRPRREPQDEETPFAPVNPYGAAKAFATNLVRIYRETHGLFAVNGICYNHESPRRGPEFVTGKICRAAAAIRLGRQSELKLGDLSAQRDWGDAREFVEGFWHSLQHSSATDFVFATGQLHSVQDLAEVAFASLGLDWREYVKVDPGLFRPAEAARLVGNAHRARELLGWEPRHSFRELIAEMTQSALAELQSQGVS